LNLEKEKEREREGACRRERKGKEAMETGADIGDRKATGNSLVAALFEWKILYGGDFSASV